MRLSEIVGIKSTTNQTAVLTALGAVYLIDHKGSIDPSEYTMKDSNLTDIVQLESNISHFLALKKKIRPPIREWDTSMLQSWLGKVGFGRIQRIIRNCNVTGVQLATGSDSWMQDTLGLPDENWCLKLKREI